VSPPTRDTGAHAKPTARYQQQLAPVAHGKAIDQRFELL